jgi:hypothetical protein
MPRARGLVQESEVQRWLLEDENAEWLNVRQFSPFGETNRTPSQVTDTVHTTFSKIEKGLLVAVEHNRNLGTFQAQRRLDRAVSLAAAKTVGVPHQVYPKSSIPYVMTVDARIRLVSFRHERWSKELHTCGEPVPDNLASALKNRPAGAREALDSLERWGVLLRTYAQLEATLSEVQWTVYDSKREDDLLERHTLEVLSISRKACHHLGWQYHIVTEKTLPDEIIGNIEWIRRGQRKPLEVELPVGLFTELPRRMLADLPTRSRAMPIADYCDSFEMEHALLDGIGLRVLQVLLWTKALTVDVTGPSIHERSLGALSVASRIAKGAC